MAYSRGETVDKRTMKSSMTISLVTFHRNSIPTVSFRGVLENLIEMVNLHMHT